VSFFFNARCVIKVVLLEEKAAASLLIRLTVNECCKNKIINKWDDLGGIEFNKLPCVCVCVCVCVRESE